MRVAFLGNSEFSVTVLDMLRKSRHLVVCVVSSIDKQSGRGNKIVYSDVKKYAISHNIPFLQFKSVSREGEEAIRRFMPDVLVTASFGQMLKENILNLAPYGVINVHASLLPKYRGSAPINYAIINGEKKTGITIMKTALSLDSGDMILKKDIDIGNDETAGDLLKRLSILGGELLNSALDKIEDGTAILTPQNEEEASYYPKLDKNMSFIDFDKTAKQIKDFCRGLNPWPVARVNYKGNVIKVYEATPYDNVENINLASVKSGDIVVASGKKGLVVKCSGGLVRLKRVQAENSKLMDDTSFLNGRKLEVGSNLGENK